MLESLMGRDLGSKSHQPWDAALRWLLPTSSHHAQLEQHPCTLGWVFGSRSLLCKGLGRFVSLFPQHSCPNGWEKVQ